MILGASGGISGQTDYKWQLIIIGNWLCFCNCRGLCNSYFYRVYSNKAFKILTILATRQKLFTPHVLQCACFLQQWLSQLHIHILKTTFLDGFFVLLIFTFWPLTPWPLTKILKMLQVTSILCLCVFVNLCMLWWICLGKQ